MANTELIIAVTSSLTALGTAGLTGYFGLRQSEDRTVLRSSLEKMKRCRLVLADLTEWAAKNGFEITTMHERIIREIMEEDVRPGDMEDRDA